MAMPSLGNNWKSTVQGVLSFAVITLLTLQGYLVAMATTPTLNKVLIGVNISIGLAKVWLAFFQHDAGTVSAIVPGQPGVQQVPAHEVPDQPGAVAVVPKP